MSIFLIFPMIFSTISWCSLSFWCSLGSNRCLLSFFKWCCNRDNVRGLSFSILRTFSLVRRTLWRFWCRFGGRWVRSICIGFCRLCLKISESECKVLSERCRRQQKSNSSQHRLPWRLNLSPELLYSSVLTIKSLEGTPTDIKFQEVFAYFFNASVQRYTCRLLCEFTIKISKAVL